MAFYASGQLLTEEYYVAAKLAKGFLRTNNFDTNSRLCMASAAVGYARSLGSDGPPAAYADIEEADCFFLIGTNTADCHPITFKRIRRRKLARPDEVFVMVADPRWTETADLADLHLSLRPGSDIALLNGMLHVLWAEGRLDARFIAAHTSGWEALQAAIERYPPERAAAITGLSAEAIRRRRAGSATARAALSLWSMGVNQSHIGTDKNAAIINLHLATGQIGRPGAGPFSLTGQPNAMGGRETGGLSHLLPGYRRIDDAGARALVERAWGFPQSTISPRPGRSALEIFEGLAAGRGARGVDHLHQSGRLDARPRPGGEGTAPGRAGDRPGRLPPDGDHALRRHPPARRPVAGEGRRHDQLRAPSHVPAQADGAARGGAARRGDPHPLRPRDGLEGRLRLREHRGHLRRVRGAHRGHRLRLHRA